MPLFGPPNVDKLKAKRDVLGLIKALGYQQYSNVRGAAVGALGQLGDDRAVEPLIGALHDKNADVRGAAMEALTAIGVSAVEPLIGALRDEDRFVRDAAAQTLGQLG
jgi:HEAT repeat protein